MAHGDELVVDNVYGWDELALAFGFKPKWLGAVGGMAPRPDHGALILVTHPGGGKSFDYNDHWDDETGELVYTGRGQEGDQTLEGANRHLAENRYRNFVFAGAGTKRLKYLGQARCTGTEWAEAPGRDGLPRKVLRFRLRIDREETPTEVAITVAKFFGGGESDAHRDLKLQIAHDPTLIGLPPDAAPSVEHRFLSPDRADLVFKLADGRVVAVEVELEGLANTLVGAWQAAKYRTLVALQEGWPIGDARAGGVLAAHSIPERVRAFCREHGIACAEVPRT